MRPYPARAKLTIWRPPQAIRELLGRDPFEPFRILTSAGESFTVRDPHTVALLKSEVFIAHHNSDRRTFLPYLHVAAIDTIRNGRSANGSARRKRR